MIKQSESKLTVSSAAPTRSIVSIVKAVIKAHIFLVVCFAALALVYTYTKMPNAYLTPCIHVISALSLILAGFEASRKVRYMGYLHGAVAGVMCAVIRILLGYAIFKSYIPSDSIAKTVALAVLISAMGGIAGVNFKNNKRKK